MKSTLLSTSQVAAIVGIRKHRIEYAISAGYLPEPRIRFVGKRCFAPDEVRGVAEYFGTKKDDENEGGEACTSSSS